MKLILVCLMMAMVSAKADPQSDLQQIEILESTIKEFKKSMKNTDPIRQKRILLKVIDSENEIISIYTRLSITEAPGGNSERMTFAHNKSLIESSLQFRKTYPKADESDLIGLIAGKAMERGNEPEKAEELYKEMIGPGDPNKPVTQNKLSITIALVELLQKKQKYGEIKYILTNHPADANHSQYGMYQRFLAESHANNEEMDQAFQTLIKDLNHLKTKNLESELSDSIENYGYVMGKIINDKKTVDFTKVDETIPYLIPGMESNYLKRLILNVSVDDKKKLSGRLYEQFKSKLKISDRIQLMDVMLSQLNFSGDAEKTTFQAVQSLMQDLLNSSPEDIGAISTNKMNSLKVALGKAEKASFTYYKTTKDTTPLIFVYSGQLKVETKNNEIRGKILTNLFSLYIERKDLARAGNAIQHLSKIKGQEAKVLQLSLELDQKEYELQSTDANVKLEPKSSETFTFDPSSPKTVFLKKWFDHLNAAKKNKAIDSKFLSYSTFELFKACYLNGALKTASDLTVQLLSESPTSETSMKSMTLMLETYRLGNDRKNQNRLADLILSTKSPDSMVKIAKQIKDENILIQQEELMKAGDHEKAAALADQMQKQGSVVNQELLVNSQFLSAISLLELKREADAVKKLEQVIKSNQEPFRTKARTPLAIARYRLADQTNELDSIVASGLQLIQLSEATKETDEALNAIIQDKGFAKKILFYSWMSNGAASKELFNTICAKNSKYPVQEECENIAQSEILKKKADECANPLAIVSSASKMDPLFLIPLSKSIQKCVMNWISKKKSVTASIKISLLDDSITKSAALIKSVDDSVAPMKGYYDSSFYPEILLASARLNADLADKIEDFKMKGISGADLETLKFQQKQLADPFRSTAKAKIKAAFEATNEALNGVSQMKPILEIMAKVDPEGYQATIENWKPIHPSMTLSDTMRKIDPKIPADVAQIIRTYNLKWMTYHFLIRQGSSQNDDAFKLGTLALGTAIYQLVGLDSKVFGILEDSIYRSFTKPWIGPYVEAAYSSLNSKMTKRACEVLSNEDTSSFANHCAWVRP